MSQEGTLKEILGAQFRANPAYELILFDRLPDAHRAQLASLQTDPSFYGVLWPNAAGLPMKAVDRETALLFFTLQQPGPIPLYVRAAFGRECNQAIAELVLDGVLEIGAAAAGPGETYVSAAAAYDLVYAAAPPGTAPGREGAPAAGGRLARLSADALRYGETVDVAGAPELAFRLYTYNTVPASPAWRRLLPGEDAAARYLGIEPGGKNRGVFDRWYTEVASPAGMPGWRAWRLRQERAAGQRGNWRAAYKLYISPRPEALPGILAAVVDALGQAGTATFKIGRDLHGLLRPDKIVAYCASFDELGALAARLQAALAGCPAQGVPFTGEIDRAGLLSWGADPPAHADDFTGQEQESWRFWVAGRLAVALIAGKTQAAGPSTGSGTGPSTGSGTGPAPGSAGLPRDSEAGAVSPARFALERLRLDGVDTTTWTPRQAIWQEGRRG